MKWNSKVDSVRDAKGVIDQEATIQKFAALLDTYIVETENKVSMVADAVTAVFEKYRGARMNMDAIATFAIASLDASPSAHADLKEAVVAYIQQNQGTIFESAKGRNGGTIFLAHKPVIATPVAQ